MTPSLRTPAGTPAETMLRVVSYNVHRGRGMDRRVVPQRIARVLAALSPDLAGLQEVVGASLTSPGHVPVIAAGPGLDAAFAQARELRGHAFGNLVLSRHRLVRAEQFTLTWAHREPRVLQRTLADVAGRRVQFFNVHLGTSLRERREQATLLARYLEQCHAPELPTIVVGDFNEWHAGPVAAVLRGRYQDAEAMVERRLRRSYPGLFPMLHLDHVYHSAHFTVRDAHLVRTRLTLVASDHLPLVADLVLPPG